jgi:hypothetical protein
LGSIITNDAKCARGIKSGIAIAKEALNTKEALYANKPYLDLRKKLTECCIWSIVFMVL